MGGEGGGGVGAGGCWGVGGKEGCVWGCLSGKNMMGGEAHTHMMLDV